ncbi:MAG: hypothetical protein Q9227_007357 [Pyrenula ochraceoflavens]
MSALFRDAPVGQIVRLVTRNKYLQYPEERTDFQCPSCYPSAGSRDDETTLQTPAEPTEKDDEPARRDSYSTPSPATPSLATPATMKDLENPMELAGTRTETLSKIVTRPEMEKVTTRKDLERAYTAATQQEALKNEPSRPIIPTKTADGTILGMCEIME